MKRFVIGIDPDIDKSGFAVLDKSTREVAAGAHPFPMLITMLSHYREVKGDVVVVVEAGWKNAITNYHTGAYGKAAQRIALNVGRNQQVGHCIVELCKAWGIEVVEKAPLRKIWRGPDRKITHAELAAFVPRLPSRTNQEIRDAVLLAWDYAGFPIRLTTISILETVGKHQKNKR